MDIVNSTFADNQLSLLTSTSRNIQLAGATSFRFINSIAFLTVTTGRSILKPASGIYTATNSIINDNSHGFAGGITNANPLLAPLASNGGLGLTMLLNAGSPAIDTGNNAMCTATDQRGFARPKSVGAGAQLCDVGAIEVQ